jgi:hypothetical protein
MEMDGNKARRSTPKGISESGPKQKKREPNWMPRNFRNFTSYRYLTIKRKKNQQEKSKQASEGLIKRENNDGVDVKE